jgi:hypothetical protein
MPTLLVHGECNADGKPWSSADAPATVLPHERMRVLERPNVARPATAHRRQAHIIGIAEGRLERWT